MLKKVPKKRINVKKELPEAFMASFFAGLEIYQTKMLVSHSLTVVLKYLKSKLLA